MRIFARLAAFWTFGCIDRPSTTNHFPPPSAAASSRVYKSTSRPSPRHRPLDVRARVSHDGNRPFFLPTFRPSFLFGYGIFPRHDIYSLDNTPFPFPLEFLSFQNLFFILVCFFSKSLEKLGYAFFSFSLYSRLKK